MNNDLTMAIGNPPAQPNVGQLGLGNQTIEKCRQYTSRLTDHGKKLVISIAPAGNNRLTEFKALLGDVLVRVANYPAGQLHREIEAVFRHSCEFLGIERAGLWCSFADADNAVNSTHWYPGLNLKRAISARAPEVNTAPDTSLPWLNDQLNNAREVFFCTLAQLPPEAQTDKELLKEMGLGGVLVVPIEVDGLRGGALAWALSSEDRSIGSALVESMELVARVLGESVACRLNQEQLKVTLAETRQALTKSNQENKELKERLQAETDYLKTEFKVSQTHRDIIGRSQAIKRVLHRVEQVAPASCAVLITGETGTGKELIARAIHRLSPRKERLMVMVNCAALPSTLVESELFGRERGAYTGALTSEVGRFEVADGSTIFLDEIGELSLEVQAKLLRVLQEGEFQRLGNPKTRKVNVRVITATNKDLAKEVRAGKFREDLFYRLQVFPVNVPPLRERMEDLPLLVSAFVDEFASRMSKQISRVPRKVVEILQQHSWPGNIRELRNVIERGVILSSGDALDVSNLIDASQNTNAPATSLADAEREHILKTLGEANWRVKGPYGAAKRLQMNPSTLYSRMAKLGINRPGARF
ncbi:MAG TPA: sigma 54-interacting transcriptional regulator [Candidatus Dormibacteraeota bacterium]|nr:sigma 54-interacting transcriptional regulator [Candidatus Dormibacteraeota bacterium]